MNLGSLHHMGGNGIHKHHIINGYEIHTCHDHCWNAWKSCVGIVFCADDEACHSVNTELILRTISRFPSNQLLSGLIWILPLVHINIRGWIQSYRCLNKYPSMPVVQAVIRPSPARQDKTCQIQNVRVAQKYNSIQSPWLVFHVSTWRHPLMAGCQSHLRIVAEETCHQILNVHIDDHRNYQVSWWDLYGDHCRG